LIAKNARDNKSIWSKEKEISPIDKGSVHIS